MSSIILNTFVFDEPDHQPSSSTTPWVSSERNFDEYGIHVLFQLSNFTQPDSRSIILPALRLASRMLECERAFPIWHAIFDADDDETKVPAEECVPGGLSNEHYLLAFGPRQDHSAAAARDSIAEMWRLVAQNLAIGWREMEGSGDCRTGMRGDGQPHSSLFLSTTLKHRILFAEGPGNPGYDWAQLMVASTMVHELTHAAMQRFRDDGLHRRMPPSRAYRVACCDTSEEGFEVEKAIFGGIPGFQAVRNHSRGAKFVPTLLQWPDPTIVAHYQQSHGICARNVPSEVAPRSFQMPWEFIFGLFTAAPSTPLTSLAVEDLTPLRDLGPVCDASEVFSAHGVEG
ncbi:hypothetical protein LTR62_003930 [Meristemomyces frigidus]|uniref:Uncharacterized protein n=1 Tax=Meristemomyces frigidus TaxID=1508187 RepID=A0AAN7TG76_9PEZI|nr:hypothetical protein LTR62_003930 [Meristemomyces frigidus]